MPKTLAPPKQTRRRVDLSRAGYTYRVVSARLDGNRSSTFSTTMMVASFRLVVLNPHVQRDDMNLRLRLRFDIEETRQTLLTWSPRITY